MAVREGEMAIKDILLLLDSDGEGQPASAYAGALAHELGAHLTAAGIAFEILAPAAFAGEYPYEMLAAITEQSRERAAKAYEKLRAASPESLRSELVQIDALPGQARDDFARLARHFDMTIIGQGKEPNSDDELLAESALFSSGRPVLFVPRIQSKPPRFERALIAWDGSHAAARALSDAMPLLEKAKTIEVVTISGPRTSYKELPGFNITRHLSRHGLKAELKQLPVSGDIGDTLLSYAADAGSDFLVMGGYGHSRLREFVLGGTTRTILTSMTLPVLMSH
jgi:nucleotide-binding universal stress UspA family protein